MFRVDDATAPTNTDRMNGHLMDPVMDAHRAIDDRRSHRLADQPPWHRVGIAIDLDRAVGLHATDQFTCGLEGRPPGYGLQRMRLSAPEALNRCFARRAMLA